MKVKPSPPIVYVLWLIASIFLLFFFLFNNSSFLFCLINTLVISAILYFLFVNKACLLSINNETLNVNYLFPMKGTILIDLREVESIKFELGYFYFFEEDAKTSFLYLLHPYDIMTIRFKEVDKMQVILFNSNMFKTIKIYRFLKKKYSKTMNQ